MLARILGIFHIDYKNNLTGEGRRLDVLVMENLFHNRPGITHIYDLKGSLRGRLITNTIDASGSELTAPASSSSSAPATVTDTVAAFTTAARAPVLLDQNFINQSKENPIYLRLHSKVTGMRYIT